MFDEINKLLKSGISDAELVKAKNSILFDLITATTTPDGRASYFANQLLLTGNIKEIDQIVGIVNKITIEDILKTAMHIFSDKPKITILTKSLKEIAIPEVEL